MAAIEWKERWQQDIWPEIGNPHCDRYDVVLLIVAEISGHRTAGGRCSYTAPGTDDPGKADTKQIFCRETQLYLFKKEAGAAIGQAKTDPIDKKGVVVFEFDTGYFQAELLPLYSGRFEKAAEDGSLSCCHITKLGFL